MDFEKVKKESFAVIGKEGPVSGNDYEEELWDMVRDGFMEVWPLNKGGAQQSTNMWSLHSADGKLFLAGIEVEDDSVAPEGWTKWVVPAYEYIQVKNQIGAEESAKTWLSGNNLELVGPVLRVSNLMDMTDTLCFPVKKI